MVSANQPPIAWLEAQISQKQQKIAQLKTDLEAEEALLASLQVVYDAAKSSISAQKPAIADLSDRGGRQAENLNQDLQDSLQDDAIEAEEPQNNLGQRNPKDMMFSHWRGFTLGAVAQKILEQSNDQLNPDDLVAKIFDTQSDDEKSRARNSLAAELRRGAKEGKWQWCGRSLFASNSFRKESSSEEMNNPES